MCSSQSALSIPQSAPKAVRLCQGCDLAIEPHKLPKGQSAFCPRCNLQLYKGGTPSLGGNLALAITCLLLFVPSHFFPFITIRLFGVMIPATLPSGTFTLISEGFVWLGLLILFCSSIAPLLVSLGVILIHLSQRFRWLKTFRFTVQSIQYLKHWMMLDVFLVSLGVSCFKLQDYADIYMNVGLIGIVALQIFSLILIARFSARRYWDLWQPAKTTKFKSYEVHCGHCHLSQPEGEKCVRCEAKLSRRKKNSIQKTWAYLIASSVCIIPANVIPISVLITNGQRLEDTIFSGVASLVVSDMLGIAIIIFVASIVVPVAKILGLMYLLLAIQFKRRVYHKQRMIIYYVVKWVGKWSVMDLFVISIMMTLLDRGQILDFTPGYGAVFFGIVVVLTMLAADSFDPRLIWDNLNDKEPEKANTAASAQSRHSAQAVQSHSSSD
ncbi:paraquat-inducible protein A [Vibrio maerlii]|uniref:paraquat-inducible protein A n=1 Tax=Vibrio maerlii TaxID=2231648 RepID=UPI000E3E7EF0|nr:paraquat-inducible protein A [Vibrio maerlii]